MSLSDVLRVIDIMVQAGPGFDVEGVERVLPLGTEQYPRQDTSPAGAGTYRMLVAYVEGECIARAKVDSFADFEDWRTRRAGESIAFLKALA